MNEQSEAAAADEQPESVQPGATPSSAEHAPTNAHRIAEAMALGEDTPVPTITVMCTTPACSAYQQQKVVAAGIPVGDDVIIVGTHSCSICGMVTFITD